jgi:multiple sugar transport system permease protein
MTIKTNSKLNKVFDKLKNSGKNIYNKRLSTKYKRQTTVYKGFDILATILKYFLLYGLSFVIIFPILQQLSIAIRAPEDINNPLVYWIPEKFSLMNFKVAFIVLDFFPSLINTFVLSFFVTLIQIIVCALCGYALARLQFKGKKILMALVIVLIVVAPTTIELPLKDTMRNFLGTGIKLSGSPMALYVLTALGLGIKSGLFIYLFRQYFKNIPVELEDAAYIDGANPFQVFIHIMLPNVRGAVILTGILTFVWQWNDSYYTTNFVSTDVSNMYNTLTTKIMGVRGNIQSAIQQAGVWQLFNEDVTKNPLFTSMILNTCAILSMIPLIIFYLFIQRVLFTETAERSGLTG